MPPKAVAPQPKRPIANPESDEEGSEMGTEETDEEDLTDEEGSEFTDSEGSEEPEAPRRGPVKQPPGKAAPVKGPPAKKAPPGTVPPAKAQPGRAVAPTTTPPPASTAAPPATSTTPAQPQSGTAAKPGGVAPLQEPAKKAPDASTAVVNKPHDEEISVADPHHRKTPEPTSTVATKQPTATGAVASSHLTASLGTSGVIRNDHNDEFQEAGPSAHVETPRKDYGASPKQQGPGSDPRETAQLPEPKGDAGRRAMQEVKPLGKQLTSTPGRGRSNRDSSSEASSEDDYDAVMHGPKGGTTGAKEYNPEEYEHVNRKVTAEVRQLFGHITAYHPTAIELPTKLRPFIPEYYPAVGDMDTFCKVPRPDHKPDNLGLTVVDEPCSDQSNPAVVKIGLVQSSKVSPAMTFVDSVEDAHNRPQVIDKWVSDIKALQHKKPLPTVNYTKPMTDIEKLLQVWPPELEDLLSSDVSFPPPTIDLDISQYVRLLCTMLDIPTYTNLIESLHVMFTLYLEFRANQHFQHV